MKHLSVPGLSVLGLAVLGLAWLALTPAHAAPAVEPQACNAEVDVTDTDPKGTNVRATPGCNAIASLKNPGEGWIELHLTAQAGDWFEIDQARLLDTMLPTGEKILFQGKGYVHKSMVGLSGMQNGGKVYADHDEKSRLLDPHADGDQPVELLGCSGDFLHVRLKKSTGWTREACTNMNTTCA